MLAQLLVSQVLEAKNKMRQNCWASKPSLSYSKAFRSIPDSLRISTLLTNVFPCSLLTCCSHYIGDFKKLRQQRQRKRRFAIIPICSACTMSAELSSNGTRGDCVQFKQRLKNLPSCAHVLQKTLNLVISCCRLAEYGKEMYQNSKRTCRAFVFSSNPIVL